MRKIVALLIVGLVVLSLVWSSPIVLAQEDEHDEPDDQEHDGQEDDGGTGPPPDEPHGIDGPSSNGTGGEQGETRPFEIPMFVIVAIVLVVIGAVIGLLVRRRKSGEYIPEVPELAPPPIEAAAPVFTPAV